MLFSKKQYCEYLEREKGFPLTLKETEDAKAKLARVKAALIAREEQVEGVGYIGKWLRPWHVVPRLREFAPPVNDFGIGLEIEYGFVSLDAARQVAERVNKWKHITLDKEGGLIPIEVSFAPRLYSTFTWKSLPCRYTRYLARNPDFLAPHPTKNVGTHVNVSMGGVVFSANRLDLANMHLAHLGRDLWIKYFGREPYNYGQWQQHAGIIEWKLFISQTDYKRLMQYVDEAVELTRLVGGAENITEASVIRALEEGFNKRTRRPQQLRKAA